MNQILTRQKELQAKKALRKIVEAANTLNWQVMVNNNEITMEIDSLFIGTEEGIAKTLSNLLTEDKPKIEVVEK